MIYSDKLKCSTDILGGFQSQAWRRLAVSAFLPLEHCYHTKSTSPGGPCPQPASTIRQATAAMHPQVIFQIVKAPAGPQGKQAGNSPTEPTGASERQRDYQITVRGIMASSKWVCPNLPAYDNSPHSKREFAKVTELKILRWRLSWVTCVAKYDHNSLYKRKEKEEVGRSE